jgi:hypothetical protein
VLVRPSADQKEHFSTGATFGRKKPKNKKKKQNSKVLNFPSPYKASPCHITLRKQEGSHNTRCRLQTYLGDADKQDWMLKE